MPSALFGHYHFLRISCEVEIKQPRTNHISHSPGSQEPWCGNAGCQQGEHSKPACGCGVRGSGTTLHGSVHSHSGGRGEELVAGTGGASQGSASERRCRAQSLHPSPLFPSLLSPPVAFRSGPVRATHTDLTTPFALL